MYESSPAESDGSGSEFEDDFSSEVCEGHELLWQHQLTLHLRTPVLSLFGICRKKN